jgi:hypothetical protein
MASTFETKVSELFEKEKFFAWWKAEMLAIVDLTEMQGDGCW